MKMRRKMLIFTNKKSSGKPKLGILTFWFLLLLFQVILGLRTSVPKDVRKALVATA